MSGAWTILGLDMATCTGFCEGDGSTLPDHGYWDLPAPVDGDRGATFTTFRSNILRRVEKAHAAGKHVTLAFEQPILPKPFMKAGRLIYPTNIQTTLLLQGLAAIAEQVAYETGCECGYVDIGTVKKTLAGSGKADKADMVHTARKMGFTIERDDTADAAGVWLAALIQFDRERADRWIARAWTGRGSLL